MAAPLDSLQRIHALDTVRGFAVLGILIMNIWSFAGPQAIFEYPYAVADWGGAPVQTWAVMHTLFEGSQRAVFSMLFGAGMLLMVGRLDEGSIGGSGRIYYRRLMFLMLFGLFDLFVLLWPGDILFVYGVCGLLLYPLRRLRASTLLLLAGALFSIIATVRVLDWQDAQHLQQIVSESTTESAAAVAANMALDEPATPEQRAEWAELQNRARPDLSTPKAQEGIRIYQSGEPLEFILKQLRTSLILLFVLGLRVLAPDSLGAMLVGMALLRSGILTLQAPRRSYLWLMLAGYGIGVPLAAWETWLLIANNFDPVLKARLDIHYDLRRIAVACGHLGALLLFCRAYQSGWLATRIAAVGRMALTNYLAQTVIGVLLFSTLGLGWYAQFTGYYLYLVVAGIWALQVAWSNWWLLHYRMGPVEWLWRSFTYKQRQPLVRS